MAFFFFFFSVWLPWAFLKPTETDVFHLPALLGVFAVGIPALWFCQGQALDIL